MSIFLNLEQVPDQPKAVFFDLDGTFYSYEECNSPALDRVIAAVAERFNRPEDAVREAFEMARRTVKGRLGPVASRHSRMLYFHAMLEGLGVGSQPEEALRLEQLFWREYLIRMKLFPGVRDLLSMLRSFGIQIGLITDLTTQIQFRKLMVLEIAGTFDAIVTSEEVAGEKETGAPYRLAIEKLGLSEQDPVWMVGDTDSDISSAHEHIGALTFHFFGDGGQLKREKADVEFDNFNDLNGVLNDWFTGVGKTSTGFGRVRSGFGFGAGARRQHVSQG